MREIVRCFGLVHGRGYSLFGTMALFSSAINAGRLRLRGGICGCLDGGERERCKMEIGSTCVGNSAFACLLAVDVLPSIDRIHVWLPLPLVLLQCSLSHQDKP
jgi:hypothetical protein